MRCNFNSNDLDASCRSSEPKLHQGKRTNRNRQSAIDVDLLSLAPIVCHSRAGAAPTKYRSLAVARGVDRADVVPAATDPSAIGLADPDVVDPDVVGPDAD